MATGKKHEKGQSDYTKHVAKQQFPKRFRPWQRLSAEGKAFWAAGGIEGARKRAEADAKKATKATKAKAEK